MSRDISGLLGAGTVAVASVPAPSSHSALLAGFGDVEPDLPNLAGRSREVRRGSAAEVPYEEAPDSLELRVVAFGYVEQHVPAQRLAGADHPAVRLDQRFGFDVLLDV